MLLIVLKSIFLIDDQFCLWQNNGRLTKKNQCKISNQQNSFLRYTSKPTHITHKIFGTNYAVIHEVKPVLTLNKPIYVGFTAPELSKWLTYDFHYNFLKIHFDAELLFTDTDSLTYEIKLENIHEEFFKHKHLFNFSNLSRNSKFLDETNKKVNGKMKDNSEGKINDEFVRLKSKMYSIKNIDSKEPNTAKGVNIATEFNEFKDTLFNKKVVRHKMKRIQSKKHKIGTYKINKISLLCFDDKRFVLDDGIHTLDYFHKDLRKNK